MARVVNSASLWTAMLLLSTKFHHCHGAFREFEDPPEWDIMEDGPLFLYLKAENYVIPSNESDKNAATWETRVICYGNSANISDIPPENCGIPGPTIVLHPNNQVQSVYLVNNLTGLGTKGHINPNDEGYNDPDVINLHVCPEMRFVQQIFVRFVVIDSSILLLIDWTMG